MDEEIKNNIPEDDDIVELTDEDGVVTKFQYLSTVPHDGQEYVVLMVLDEDGDAPEDDDEGEVVILQIEKDENGEDIYVGVDDDDVSQAVFELFMAGLDAEDDED